MASQSSTLRRSLTRCTALASAVLTAATFSSCDQRDSESSTPAASRTSAPDSVAEFAWGDGFGSLSVLNAEIETLMKAEDYVGVISAAERHWFWLSTPPPRHEAAFNDWRRVVEYYAFALVFEDRADDAVAFFGTTLGKRIDYPDIMLVNMAMPHAARSGSDGIHLMFDRMRKKGDYRPHDLLPHAIALCRFGYPGEALALLAGDVVIPEDFAHSIMVVFAIAHAMQTDHAASVSPRLIEMLSSVTSTADDRDRDCTLAAATRLTSEDLDRMANATVADALPPQLADIYARLEACLASGATN